MTKRFLVNFMAFKIHEKCLQICQPENSEFACKV